MKTGRLRPTGKTWHLICVSDEHQAASLCGERQPIARWQIGHDTRPLEEAVDCVACLEQRRVHDAAVAVRSARRQVARESRRVRMHGAVRDGRAVVFGWVGQRRAAGGAR